MVTDGNGIPLSGIITSASISEFKLILPALDRLHIENRPLHIRKRLETIIADKGYDAKWVRDGIRKRKMSPKIPKRRKKGQKEEPEYNQKIKPYYRTRWIVERTFAWLGNWRRVVTRYERLLCNYQAFFHLACIMICLNQVLK